MVLNKMNSKKQIEICIKCNGKYNKIYPAAHEIHCTQRLIEKKYKENGFVRAKQHHKIIGCAEIPMIKDVVSIENGKLHKGWWAPLWAVEIAEITHKKWGEVSNDFRHWLLHCAQKMQTQDEKQAFAVFLHFNATKDQIGSLLVKQNICCARASSIQKRYINKNK